MVIERNRMTPRQVEAARQGRRVYAIARSCRRLGLPEPERELRFHPTRRWRFDLAWPAARVAFEYEGGAEFRSKDPNHHTTPAGYRNDCEKYNAAQILGWTVIRGTASMVDDGTAAQAVADAYRARGGTPA